jgi:hypothetical protein
MVATAEQTVLKADRAASVDKVSKGALAEKAEKLLSISREVWS